MLLMLPPHYAYAMPLRRAIAATRATYAHAADAIDAAISLPLLPCCAMALLLR